MVPARLQRQAVGHVDRQSQPQRFRCRWPRALGRGAQLSEDQTPLIAAAIAAAYNAYAPYSNFHVGAALLMADGSIISGANFENASYGMTFCAETVAIACANSAGRLADIVAIAVVV